jgi:hypothetical protein
MDALNEGHIQSKAKYYAISASKYSVLSASVDIGRPDPAPLCVTRAGAISPISCGMTNPYAHDPDCDFWHGHYESECTCSRHGMKPPAADLAQDMRAICAEIAELRRRIEQLEARVATMPG